MKKSILVFMVICGLLLCACGESPPESSAVTASPMAVSSDPAAVSSEPVSSQETSSEPISPVEFEGEILKLPEPTEIPMLYPVFIKVAEPEYMMGGWDGYIIGALDEKFNPVIKAQHKEFELASFPEDGEPLYYKANNLEKPGSMDILDNKGQWVSTIEVGPEDDGYHLQECAYGKYFIANLYGGAADRLFRLNGEKITLPAGLKVLDFTYTNEENLFSVQYNNQDYEDESIPKGENRYLLFNAETGEITPTDVDTAHEYEEAYRLEHNGFSIFFGIKDRDQTIKLDGKEVTVGQLEDDGKAKFEINGLFWVFSDDGTAGYVDKNGEWYYKLKTK